MKITDILSEDLVLPALAGRSKDDVIEELARAVAERHRDEVDLAKLVRVRELLEEAGAALRLRLVSGARGLEGVVALPRLQQPGLALAGYLPQLHPDRVQVLGNSETSYLATLEPARARAAVAAVATAGVACFVVTNDTPPPAVLTEPAEAAGVAVLGSALRTADFIRSTTAWLEERMAPEVSLHGDLVEIHGLGVLILGKSGIGKSPAALNHLLRSRGQHGALDFAERIDEEIASRRRRRAGEPE